MVGQRSTQKAESRSVYVTFVSFHQSGSQSVDPPPDALNRYSESSNVYQTVHLAKYIFPRQFGLHNVFTSKVDSRETAQTFKDYTLREQEIDLQEKCLQAKGKTASRAQNHVPKRLRGNALKLIQDLQRRSSKCSYSMLLQHYCPLPSSLSGTVAPSNHQNSEAALPTWSGARQPSSDRRCQQSQLNASASRSSLTVQCKTSRESKWGIELSNVAMTDLATPYAQVSAYCRAVLSKLIPDGFWGRDEQGKQNKEGVMGNVDQFVRLRRFESMSLHLVFQNIQVRLDQCCSPSLFC